MILGIDHIDIGVSDVEKCVKELLAMGFKEIRRSDQHGGTVQLQCPGAGQPIFELHPTGHGGVMDTRVNHIAFKVDDIQETYEDLTSKGLVFIRAPRFNKSSQRTLCNLDDPDNPSSGVRGEPRHAMDVWGFIPQLVDAEK